MAASGTAGPSLRSPSAAREVISAVGAVAQEMLVDGTAYGGSKWRHIPASNRDCPDRVARRSIVTVFLLSL